MLSQFSLAAAVCLLALFVYYAFKPRPLGRIPYNKDIKWMTGDIPFLARIGKETGAITRAFDMTAIRHGPISQIVIGTGNSWLSKLIGFGQIIVILSDSQEIYDILVNRAAEFDRAKSISQLFEATLPEGLLGMQTHDQFKHHKRWLGISMTSPYLARMIPRMTESIMELVDLWSLSSRRLLSESSNEKAFSVIDDIRLATIDIIASITFGASFGSIRTAVDLLDHDHDAHASARPATPELASSLEVLINTIGDNSLFPFPSWLPWWTRTFNWKWARAHKLLYTFLGKKLDSAKTEYDALELGQDRPEAHRADNVLDMILEKEREDHLKGNEALSRTEILDELATYALGGSETTATTMQWSMKILARHPDVQRRLRQELVEQLPPLGERTPNFEELSSVDRLPYLSAVVNELLRTSRTAAAVARDTTRDTTLLGHHIPKGTYVLLTIGYTQQYEDDSHKVISDRLDSVRSETSRKGGRKHGYWSRKDVAEFQPERWLASDGSFNPNAGPWMPFSFGFRGCFGQKLAILELRLFLVLVQLTFFLDEVPKELDGWGARESVTNHPTQCYIRPIPWSEIET